MVAKKEFFSKECQLEFSRPGRDSAQAHRLIKIIKSVDFPRIKALNKITFIKEEGYP